MAQGQNVALLDWGWGNPCLFGPSHWYVEKFKPREVVIIPGMGFDAESEAGLAGLVCAQCGESVMESRTRRLQGRTLCIPCFQDQEQ